MLLFFKNQLTQPILCFIFCFDSMSLDVKIMMIINNNNKNRRKHIQKKFAL